MEVRKKKFHGTGNTIFEADSKGQAITVRHNSLHNFNHFLLIFLIFLGTPMITFKMIRSCH